MDELRATFETWWKGEHSEEDYPRDRWLVWDDVWGEDGYRQPSVHFEWLAFKAGWNLRALDCDMSRT